MRSISTHAGATYSISGLRKRPAISQDTTLRHHPVNSAARRPARTPQVEVGLMVECLQERYMQPGHCTPQHCYQVFLFRLLELWRSEERWVGKEWVGRGRARWLPYH